MPGPAPATTFTNGSVMAPADVAQVFDDVRSWLNDLATADIGDEEVGWQAMARPNIQQFPVNGHDGVTACGAAARVSQERGTPEQVYKYCTQAGLIKPHNIDEAFINTIAGQSFRVRGSTTVAHVSASLSLEHDRDPSSATSGVSLGQLLLAVIERATGEVVSTSRAALPRSLYGAPSSDIKDRQGAVEVHMQDVTAALNPGMHDVVVRYLPASVHADVRSLNLLDATVEVVQTSTRA